ncbi:MAG: DUF4240 domain-containing protein [Clostridiales bacterium]|nr:DUF4240 domain-containing protein [Clostridiales bacterium]
MMREKEFWKIFSLFDWNYEGNDEKVLERATKKLARHSDKDICQFYEILSKLLYDLDGVEYAKNAGEYVYSDNGKFISSDAFLHARCVVVANGAKFYSEVLEHPEMMPKDFEFESLLYLASNAYQLKHGTDLPCVPKYSFESFSNKEKWS